MLKFHVHLLAAFAITFEQAQSRLMQLPRMDIEPDGYFLVAGGENEGQRWVVNGQLFEVGDKLHRVELHGACPEAMFDAFLRCFGWPEVKLAFEMVREGVTLDDAGFRERSRNTS